MMNLLENLSLLSVIFSAIAAITSIFSFYKLITSQPKLKMYFHEGTSIKRINANKEFICVIRIENVRNVSTEIIGAKFKFPQQFNLLQKSEFAKRYEIKLPQDIKPPVDIVEPHRIIVYAEPIIHGCEVSFQPRGISPVWKLPGKSYIDFVVYGLSPMNTGEYEVICIVQTTSKTFKEKLRIRVT